MKTKTATSLLFALILVGATLLSRATAPAQPAHTNGWNGCGVESCHARESDEFVNSVHQKMGVTCNQCHGGNPDIKENNTRSFRKTADLAMYQPGNTIVSADPRTEKRRIAKICAGCHSWQQGKNSNPFEEYKTSTHGRKLFMEADNRVAVCTDCHGPAHQVVPVDDAISPVHPANVPTTCGQCHDGDYEAKTLILTHDEVDTYNRLAPGELAAIKPMTPGERRFFLAMTEEERTVFIKMKAPESKAYLLMTPLERTDYLALDKKKRVAYLEKTSKKEIVYLPGTPESCQQCHAPDDLIVTGEDGTPRRKPLPATKFHEYAASIHGESVIGRGDTAAPTCATCHSAHAASPPQFSDISRICGKCHINEAKQLGQSLHAEAMESRKLSLCITCHGGGSHAIPHADEKAMLTTTCANTDCHGEDVSKQEALGGTLFSLMQEARRRVEQTQAKIETARQHGVEVEAMENQLAQANQSLTEAKPVLHSLHLTAIEKLTTAAVDHCNEVDNALEALEQTGRDHALTFWPILAFFIICIAVIALRLRMLEADHHNNAAL